MDGLCIQKDMEFKSLLIGSYKQGPFAILNDDYLSLSCSFGDESMRMRGKLNFDFTWHKATTNTRRSHVEACLYKPLLSIFFKHMLKCDMYTRETRVQLLHCGLLVCS